MTTFKRRRGQSFADHIREVTTGIAHARNVRQRFNDSLGGAYNPVTPQNYQPPAYRRHATAAERGARVSARDRLNPPPSYRSAMAPRSYRRRFARLSRRAGSRRATSRRPRVRVSGRRKTSRRPPISRRRRVLRKRIFRSRKVNRFVTAGYIIKRESGGIVSNSECGYLGHNTTPMGETWRAITYAVARWFAKKLGQDFQDVYQLVSGAPTDPNVAWKLYFKTTPNGAVATATVVSAASLSWGQWADQLLAHLLAQIASNDFFELCRIEMYSPDTVANTRDTNYCVIEAKQMIVTVVGNSNLMYQNSTLATNVVGDDVAEEIGNVNNNPLRGKEYWGYGQHYPLMFQNSTVGNLAITTDVNTGFMPFPYTGALAMSADMVFSLQKPPPFYSFHGMQGNKYITCNPGEIKRSKIVKSYTMNLQKWVQMCLPYLQAAPDGNHNNIKFLGKCRFFGLEKMLDSRTNEPDIRIAYEINLTTSAIARYFPTVKFNPQVFLNPAPVSYGP